MSLLVAASGVAALAMTSPAPVTPDPRPPPTAALAEPRLPFSSDEQLWLEVTLDGRPLTDSLDVYTGRVGVFMPLGELARLLDLAVVVLPPERRAEGWIITPDREVWLDLHRGLVSVGGRETAIDPSDAALYQGEIYVRAELLQRLLPIAVVADTAAQTLTLRAREPLPAQQRLARAGARAGLSHRQDMADARRIETPYSLFTAPSVDFSLQTGLSNRSPRESVRYDLRVGNDLLYGGFQLFAGSDDDGALSTVRVLLERKDPDGRRAGPFGATRSAVGDVFTPALALGARSSDGRGIVSTSAPIEQISAFTRLDLRGELPLGYEVELYVNEVLRGSQATSVGGRYEFQDVSLTYGLNVARLVFYGPRGERREEVRRINFGSSQLAPGASVFRFGLVQQGLPMFDVRGDTDDPLFHQPGDGDLRFVGSVDYGLTSTLTLTAGAAHHTPPSAEARTLGTIGLRSSVAGMAVQSDLAVDDLGGLAFAAGVAGRVRGLGYVIRNAEYSGGFIDELQPRGAFLTTELRRATDLFLDTQIAVPSLGVVPLSVDLHRDERTDGSRFLLAQARASVALRRWFASAFVGYERESGGPAETERLSGGADVSTLVHGAWQVRAGVAWQAVPDVRLHSAFVTVDRDIADRLALRLAATKTFGPFDDAVVQGAAIWRFDAFDVALNLGYAARDGEVRVGLQFAFGLMFDPHRGRYRGVRPGVAAGGAVAFDSYVDQNGDGRRQPGEAAVPGLIVRGGPREATTDAAGLALITGLGDGAVARLQVDPESVADPFLAAAAESFAIVPRPGRLTRIDNPLRVNGEAEVRLMLARDGAGPVGLSAVQAELVDAAGRVAAEGRTEYDGAVLFERLPPGTYTLRVQPAQSERLRLRLVAPLAVVIPAAGGFVGGLAALLEANP